MNRRLFSGSRVNRDRRDTAFKKSLRETYLAASSGTETPEVAVMNGAALNELLQTTEYDPQKAYWVTASGISEV